MREELKSQCQIYPERKSTLVTGAWVGPGDRKGHPRVGWNTRVLGPVAANLESLCHQSAG